MTWNAIKPWLGTVARLFLGVIWIWASLAKLESPREFVQAVRAYDVTPEWMSKAIGYGLPVVEFSLGVLLIVGVIVRLAAIVSAALLIVFLIGLIQAAARGLQLRCGCFSVSSANVQNTEYTWEISRDIGLIVVAAYLCIWPFTRISIEEYLQRHDYVPPPSAKRMRTAEGRRKYEAIVAARQKEARSRSMYLNLSLGIIIAVIALVGIGVQANRAKIQGDLAAPNATVTNGVVFGTKAPATVDIYEDFACPNCLRLEEQVAPMLDADVRANRAQVRYHTISILDAVSPNSYSTRSANAAICTSDVSVDYFVKFHKILYGTFQGKQVQPREGSAGPSDGAFLSYATKIGLNKGQLATFQDCVRSQTHKALVQAMTDRASQIGISGTPTVFVDGKQVGQTPSAIKAAIDAAVAKGPKPTPSTSSPAPSPSSSTPTKKPSTPVKKPSSPKPKPKPSATKKR